MGNKCDLVDKREVSIEMGRQVSVSVFVSYNILNSGTCLPLRTHGVEQQCHIAANIVISMALSCSLVSNPMCPHVFYTTSYPYPLTCDFLFTCNN